jgi:hypothetical protein
VGVGGWVGGGWGWGARAQAGARARGRKATACRLSSSVRCAEVERPVSPAVLR